MKVISFVTQKGGSGKTMICVNCACLAASGKRKVCVLDTDAQGSADNWYQTRDAEQPELIRIASDELSRAIEAVEKRGFDFCLIDTAGRDEPAIAAVIQASDYCLVPVRPTPTDLKAVLATVETIRRNNKPFAFVLAQTPARSFRINEARQALSVLGLVAPGQVVSRTSYQDAFGLGLGVTEYEPDGFAATEIKSLWNWIVSKIKKAS